LWIGIAALLLTLTVSSFGQKRPFPPVLLDEPGYPFDFTEDFYKLNGVDVDQVFNRRTGYDGLSVIWKSINPYHNNVRVLVTLPAYDQYGQMMFWYPLGDMPRSAFLEEASGAAAMQMAEDFPIYVFPDKRISTFAGFGDSRQAPLMDISLAAPKRMNPLGLREILLVRFTDKAFSGEGADLMGYMAKKNGLATDETPILKSVADLIWMRKERMVTVESTGYFPFAPYDGQYSAAPLIADPRHGVLAQDAFLLMPMENGQPLAAEMEFMSEFLCLQKTGNWCMPPLE
jgi:hypothetical protein